MGCASGPVQSMCAAFKWMPLIPTAPCAEVSVVASECRECNSKISRKSKRSGVGSHAAVDLSHCLSNKAHYGPMFRWSMECACDPV